MNRVLIILFVVFIALSSCNKKRTATITVKLLNADIEFAMLKTTEDEDAVADTAFIDSSSTIKFELQLEKPGFYLLRMRNQLIMELYLSPGDELSFELDMNKPFDEIVFTGEGEKVNNYLFKRLITDEYLLPSRDVLYRLEEKEFMVAVDKAYQIKLKNLDSFYQDNKKHTDKKFYDVYSTNLLYEWALNMISYKQRYPYISGNENYQFSKEFEDFTNKLELENSGNLISNTFRLFILRYIDLLADPVYSADTVAQKSESGYCSVRYNLVKETYKNTEIRDYLLTQILLEQVKYYGVKEISELMDLYKKDCSNTDLVAKVEAELSKWDEILPGKNAPDFSYADLDGKLISLSDFKGKVVYVDVWATWCGPCKREAPYFYNLAKEYVGKNIVFIQISVDDEKQDYLDYMLEVPENTIQLYSGGWRSKITKDYLISSIPRFILVGADGKIIDNNAKRPSDNDIKNYLDALLTAN